MASPSEQSTSGTRPAVGLRERKKAKTRAAIQRHALRLFKEQGYAETTIDQIAEAAEVSPSTYFRYFPTKEAVVVNDEHDGLMVAALLAQPAELAPIPAIRAALRVVYDSIDPETWAEENERAKLMFAEPDLRIAVFDEIVRTLNMFTDALAQRCGRPPADFQIRVIAGAVLGALSATTHNGSARLGPEYFGIADRCLAFLEAGLPLGAADWEG